MKLNSEVVWMPPYMFVCGAEVADMSHLVRAIRYHVTTRALRAACRPPDTLMSEVLYVSDS